MALQVPRAQVLIVIVYLSGRGVAGWNLSNRRHAHRSALPITASVLDLRVNLQNVCLPDASYPICARRLRLRLHAANKDADWTTRRIDDDDNEEMLSSSDWFEAELTLRSTPDDPHPKIVPHQVATLCCRSLQWIDYPAPNAGLKRCYRFFTPECRKLVTGRQYDTSTSAESVELFCQYAALSPALQPFMGATRVEVGDMTVTPAQPPARGALASFSVVIRGASVLAVQHASGMARGGVAAAPPVVHMVLRLEEQRRPPHQGCWMVREIMDVRHAFAGDMGNAHVGA